MQKCLVYVVLTTITVDSTSLNGSYVSTSNQADLTFRLPTLYGKQKKTHGMK